MQTAQSPQDKTYCVCMSPLGYLFFPSDGDYSSMKGAGCYGSVPFREPLCIFLLSSAVKEAGDTRFI